MGSLVVSRGKGVGVQLREVLALVIFLRSRSGRESQDMEVTSQVLGFGAREMVGREAAATRAERARAGSLEGLVVSAVGGGAGEGDRAAANTEGMAEAGMGRALEVARPGFVIRDLGTGIDAFGRGILPTTAFLLPTPEPGA